jgi:hypothetical protein
MSFAKMMATISASMTEDDDEDDDEDDGSRYNVDENNEVKLSSRKLNNILLLPQSPSFV